MKSFTLIAFILIQLFLSQVNSLPINEQAPNSKAMETKADPSPSGGFNVPGLGTIGNGDQFMLMGSFQGIGSKLDASNLPSLPSLPAGK